MPEAPLPPQIRKPSIGLHNLKMLVYGNAGVGKTTLLATCMDVPGMSPALMIPVDPGELALTDMPNPPDLWDVGSGDPASKIKAVEDAYRYLQAGGHPYKTLILDNLSELQKTHMNAVVLKGAATGKRIDVTDVQLKDYGMNSAYLLYILRLFRDLKIHVLVAAHEIRKEQANATDRIGPDVTPSIVNPVCGVFDLVTRLYTYQVDIPARDGHDARMQTVRGLLSEPTFQANTEIMAKDRSPGGKLGKTVINPTMSKIHALLNQAPKPKK